MVYAPPPHPLPHLRDLSAVILGRALQPQSPVVEVHPLPQLELCLLELGQALYPHSSSFSSMI